jgi:hypothetical protein
MPVIG